MAEISWDRPKLERLKVRYAQAVKDGESEFSFEGLGFVTGYAKYLIEHLETQLPK